MARTRIIKPGFFKNEELAECSAISRLLFAGLWTIADKEGRLEDRPKKIRAEILPYDECDTDRLLNELSEKRFIIRYEVDGAKYIQISNFIKHQQPHHKEIQSVIPPQVKVEPSLKQDQANDASIKVPLVPLVTCSLLLATEEKEKATLSPKSPTEPKLKQKLPSPGCFNQFWETFPRQRRGSRTKAELAYRKALTRATSQEIRHGLSAYLESSDVNDGFAKGAEAWLNADGWANSYKSARNNHSKSRPSYTDKIRDAGTEALDILRRMDGEDTPEGWQVAGRNHPGDAESRITHCDGEGKDLSEGACGRVLQIAGGNGAASQSDGGVLQPSSPQGNDISSPPTVIDAQTPEGG